MDEPLIPDPIILVDPAYERGYAEGLETGMAQAREEIERLREALSAMTELFKATEASAQWALSEVDRLREALRLEYLEFGKLANMLTGLCNSVCCHRSGGFSHKEENCECRAVAAEIVEFFQNRAALGEKE